LQIAVHQDDGLTARDFESGGRCELVAEVSRERYEDDVGAMLHLPARRGGRAVAAPVVDEHDFVIVFGAKAIDDVADALDQRRDVRRFVVERDDDTEQWSLWIPHA
jgi:hypothetical protein